MRFAVLSICAVLGACFDPRFSDRPACGTGNACPANLTCLSGQCVQAGCGGVADGDGCVAPNIADGRCLHAVCIPRGCGDGIVDPLAVPPEVCDDGNNVSGDGCSADCRSNEQCGNGIVDVNEQCDPATRNAPASQCRDDCTSRLCGDGIVDAVNNEACDDGQAANSDAPDAHCRPNCQLRRCGDGIMDTGEICDDGNIVSGDGCSADCLSNETCGNGRVDIVTGEECDDGIFGLSGDGCSSKCTLETPDWSELTPRGTGNISDVSMTYDSLRKLTILVSGSGVDGSHFATKTLLETWENDGTNWLRRITVHSPPTASSSETVAFDNIRKRVILFIGFSPGFPGDPQTWEFDGIDWEIRHPATSPPRRNWQSMTFDSIRDRVIVFGGTGPQGALSDTWEYDGINWVEIHPATSPPGRFFASSAFDTERRRVVIFGGQDDTGHLLDTWEYDGITWSLHQTATQPLQGQSLDSFSVGESMAYDSLRHKIVLFGGLADNASSGGTWEFDGSDWSQHIAATAPPRRQFQGMTYDQGNNAMIMFGGRGDQGPRTDTWRYDGTDWVQQTDTSEPAGRFEHAMAFDSKRGLAILFGGNTDAGVVGDTWEFDGLNWALREQVLAPSPRRSHSMTSDPTTGRIFLFGGQAGVQDGEIFLSDTWKFDSAKWQRIAVSNPPPPRVRMALAYDSRHARLLMFGGTGGTSAQSIILNDTWALTGSSWDQISTSHAPPTFENPVMAYDEERNIVVLVDNEARTWEFDGMDWNLCQPAISPSTRFDHSIVYDSTRARIVLVGGRDRNQISLNDTWEYDGISWRQRPSPNLARTRLNSTRAILFDTVRNRILIMGGFVGGGGVGNDVWSFGFGSASIPRDRCLAGEDSDGDGLIGCGDATHLPDPDCAGQCTPLCPATNAPVPCDPNAPHCGDGICNPFLESYLSCPVDCSRP